MWPFYGVRDYVPWYFRFRHDLDRTLVLMLDFVTIRIRLRYRLLFEKLDQPVGTHQLGLGFNAA